MKINRKSLKISSKTMEIYGNLMEVDGTMWRRGKLGPVKLSKQSAQVTSCGNKELADLMGWECIKGPCATSSYDISSIYIYPDGPCLGKVASATKAQTLPWRLELCH